jgi:hypothetical protein
MKEQIISFYKDGEYIEFYSKSKKGLFESVINWLYNNNYNFGKYIKIYTDISKLDLINRSSMRDDMFYKIDDNKYIINTFIKDYKHLLNSLVDFGCNDIELNGVKYKKSTEPSESPEKIKSFSKFFHTPDETEDDYILSDLEKNLNKPPKPQPYSKIDTPPTDNPFKQAICIIGESGVGKSYTTEEILKRSGHHYEFIIPTSATTGLLAQFSPNNSRYTTSRLGKMLIEAADNPDKFYTAVFDECHKNSTIEMINDELLQAISTKRNRYRFISLDNDTSQIYKDSNLEVERGNIKIPDNFGFIFISSKPKVIARNEDFFNRVDIVIIDRNMKNIEDLKTISPEDKLKLKRES